MKPALLTCLCGLLMLGSCTTTAPFQRQKTMTADQAAAWLTSRNKPTTLLKFCTELRFLPQSKTLACHYNGQVGLIDGDGRLVVKPEYSGIYHQKGFKKNLLVVQKGEKVGLITTRGDTILKPLYDSFDCTAFYSDSFTKDDGLCQIKQGDKIGVIRKNGLLIFDAECDRAEVGGLINNWTYKCIKGEFSHYYSHRLELLRIAPTSDDIAGNYRRRKMP